MKRRTFLKRAGTAVAVSFLPRSPMPGQRPGRRRPGDPGWPSAAAWNRLRADVDGNLIPVPFPLADCANDVGGDACTALLANIKNPWYVGDQPGLTQTLGWVDAWYTRPSVYAVAAQTAEHIAAAVNFARDNDIRLVVKGGGHSYQGGSNAPDSLLAWTRRMNHVTLHERFVPVRCHDAHAGVPAVSCDAGAVWMQAYSEVTTKGSRYVQGGGCTTVGVAGLVQSGGFGNFSKHYGTASAHLLEAEIVTADGRIRAVNACSDPDLFWALKGGGGGTLGIVTRLTLRTHDLPEYFGGALFRVTAASDAAFQRLLRQFVGFYSERLFNQHWGESVYISPQNSLGISMVSWGLAPDQGKRTWQPFLDWIAERRGDYTMAETPHIVSVPAQKWWDPAWWRQNNLPDVYAADSRTGADPHNVWWAGDAGQVAWTIYGYESLWLPQHLLIGNAQTELATALFDGSRHQGISLHFNKGLAGSPREAQEATRNTAMNPAVLDAFALAIVADAGGGYPGIRGHEPDEAAARSSRDAISRCMTPLRRVADGGGAYSAESSFFQENWQHSYWGSNYGRLASVKRQYDPAGLFFVHHGVGSEEWSDDGFTRR
ncbi:MAG: FAD-binding oxidoreductase [Gemmatimonadales bacterium]